MKLYEVELFIKICPESKGKSGSKVFNECARVGENS